MFARLPLKTAFGAAALAAAGLLLTPAAASAQAYSYQGAPQPYGGYSSQPYGYDQSSSYGYTQRPDYRDDRAYGQSYDRSNYNCRSERRGRTGAGVAVGATFGAVLGSQLGARGRRTEGSVLGAVIGGALGAAVGNDSARNCSDGYSGHVQYDDRGYDSRYQDSGRYRYEDRGYSSQGNGSDGYDDRYDDRGYQNQPYQSDDRYQSDCRPVAVHSRDQYGRTVTRYQQTC